MEWPPRRIVWCSKGYEFSWGSLLLETTSAHKVSSLRVGLDFNGGKVH